MILNKDITVGVKTFFREEKLEKCLKSLENMNFAKIIALDNGIISKKKQKIYNRAREKLPLEVIDFEFDSGIGFIQKELLSHINTPYVLIIDDDMELMNIAPLKEILEENRLIGGVTGILIEEGKLKINATNIYLKNKNIIMKNRKNLIENVFYTKKGIPFFIFDYIRFPILFKRKCLEDYNFDKNFKVSHEHLDFMWSHKCLGKWKFALTPACLIIHSRGGTAQYLKYRYGYKNKRMANDINYFLHKYGLTSIIMENTSLTENYNTSFYVENHFKHFMPFIIVKIYKIINSYLISFYIKYFQKIFNPPYLIGRKEKIFFKKSN
ncbi:MAG: glycosyltransferase family 2 protein [Promethearchaeota archaeon]